MTERAEVIQAWDKLVELAYTSGLSDQEFLAMARGRYIRHVLLRKGGNQCKAANAVRCHRNTLSRICGELGIQPKEYRAERRRFLK